MTSLYETILKSTNSGRRTFVQQKTKEIVDKVLSSMKFYSTFLEDNHFALDRDETEKVARKLARLVPHDGAFGKYGVNSLKKQIDLGPQHFGTESGGNYAYYTIEIEYGRKGVRGGLMSTIIERIVVLYKDKISVLEIPETKRIVDEIGKHFDNYQKSEYLPDSRVSAIKSRLNGKYVTYSFNDLIKEFV